mgnify:CR=1 FL=1|tara:strand:- start:1721 stop:2248 length:528 start_codon:yes stop_codon:yes gene_type:complete
MASTVTDERKKKEEEIERVKQSLRDQRAGRGNKKKKEKPKDNRNPLGRRRARRNGEEPKAATKPKAAAKPKAATKKPKQAAPYNPRPASTRTRFNAAFKKAKGAGKSEFTFDGGKYNTKTKDEVNAKKAAENKTPEKKKKSLGSKFKGVLSKLKIKPASGKRKYDPRKKRFVTVK